MDFIKVSARIFFILLAFLGASLRAETEPEHIRIADQVTHEFVREVNEDYGLLLCGSGGAMATDIKKIGLSFYSKCNLTTDELRFLVVRLSERFLSIINNEKKSFLF